MQFKGFWFSPSTWYQSSNSSYCRRYHQALLSSFSSCCLLPIRHTLLSINISSHHYHQALAHFFVVDLTDVVWIKATNDKLGDTYICPNILSGLHQQSMASPTDSTFSLASSALGFDTSLPLVLAPQADNLVILPHIVLPTPPNSAPCLLITTQLILFA